MRNWLYGLGVWVLERVGTKRQKKLIRYGKAYSMGNKLLFVNSWKKGLTYD
jgi:hypothetical protein